MNYLYPDIESHIEPHASENTLQHMYQVSIENI